MNPSRMDTLGVPAVGARNPNMVTQAAAVPLRVAVRNIGGVMLLFAHSETELSKLGQTSGVYELPTDRNETFVLAPGQALFVAAVGPAGRVCYAISEAWPLFTEGL